MASLADIQRRVGVTADGQWGPRTAAAIWAALPPLKATALADPEAFYAVVRKGLFAGSISPAQFEGIQAKLEAFGAAAWPVAYAAYGLATSYWETARTMQPIEEYGKGKGRKYGSPGKHGQVAYGRGDVQLTWDYNYERADKELGLNGALTADYSLALRPDISARIMVGGMSEGWFTGKKLSDYLPASGTASLDQFEDARRIINGTDHATDIAKVAATFQSGLVAGGWA